MFQGVALRCQEVMSSADEGVGLCGLEVRELQP